ncbi:VOC family protein [Streptomyces bobili]|uniref:VOC family protein n=1 Tax=Streptomyces bobili TaxID=67280 RepID=UPI003701B2FE
MAVRDLSHVELYTRDKVATVRFLVSTMGFTRVADSVAVDRSSGLLRQGDVQIVVTSGWATGRWRAEHGDGIADVALTCDDVSETARAALAAGATVTYSPQGVPVVSGWGPVSHTLLPAATAGPAVAPAGHTWIDSPQTPEGPRGRAHHIGHIGIRLTVADLAEYAAFCTAALDLSRLPALPSPCPAHGGADTASVVLGGGSQRVTLALTAAQAAPSGPTPPPAGEVPFTTLQFGALTSLCLEPAERGSLHALSAAG